MEKIQPSATILADSVSPDGARLTTMEVVAHRFILAEINTHRVFSRNSASSRAIPVGKIMSKVENDPAFPVYWGREQKGMQSGDELENPQRLNCENMWKHASLKALKYAKYLVDEGLHKSVTNRLLEPFMWHIMIISSTEWGNFFNQRCHKDAQPEFKAVAEKMYDSLSKGSPEKLNFGQLHAPLILPEDRNDIHLLAEHYELGDKIFEKEKEITAHVSIARCARSSYLTHHGTREIRIDLDLYERLMGGIHMSPFEHVASPCIHMKMIEDTGMGDNDSAFELRCRQWGNFYGWHQYRKSIVGENRIVYNP